MLVVRQALFGVDVAVDGTVLTQLKSPRFATLPLAPGRHEIVATAQGRSTQPPALDLHAAQSAVVRLSAGLGVIKLTREPDTSAPRTSLARVPIVETLANIFG